MHSEEEEDEEEEQDDEPDDKDRVKDSIADLERLAKEPDTSRVTKPASNHKAPLLEAKADADAMETDVDGAKTAADALSDLIKDNRTPNAVTMPKTRTHSWNKRAIFGEARKESFSFIGALRQQRVLMDSRNTWQIIYRAR